MIETKKSFKEHISEVDKYFNFISAIDKKPCKIICHDIKEIPIDDSLTKILKANLFLLLYNLIESTIRNSTTAIINSIHNENLDFKKLSNNLRSIWIDHQLLFLKDSSFNKKTIKDRIEYISKQILEDEILKFNLKKIKYDGNLDAEEIRELAHSFGYETSPNGSNLKTIKDKRNDLAHGNFTFSEIGRGYSIEELSKFKTEAISYLNDVLTKIESYINNKSFSSK